MHYPCAVSYAELLHNSGPCEDAEPDAPMCSMCGEREAYPGTEEGDCAVCELAMWCAELALMGDFDCAYTRACAKQVAIYETIARAM